MNITYTVDDMSNNESSVKVTYTNENGDIYSRYINVPYSNGILDVPEWQNRLNSHLSAVKYKLNVGAIQFVSTQ